jgi:hypothetical protein
METTHLFDLVFKKLITSSPRGLIYLINGLFNTRYPLDSPVEYLTTEHISGELKLRRSDTMIRIGDGPTYNLEAQTQEDREMVIRVFEYGFMQARDTQILTKGKIRLTFPLPKIIYLDAKGKIPTTVTLELKFPNNSIHEYRVGTFKIHDHEPEELFQQKMILLLPFYLLKLRHKVKKAKTKGELRHLAAELKSQIDNLTRLTKESGLTGILEKKDINTIQSLMERLFRELYTDYTEFEGVETMLVTEIKTYAEELEEKYTQKTEELAAIKTYAEELEERERQNKLDFVRSLKALDVPVDTIVKASGLPLDVVEKL